MNVELPTGLELVRTTSVFDQETVPAGLLRTHRVAEGAWGRLVVYSGSVSFQFEEDGEEIRLVEAGDHVVIPPARPHRLTVDKPVSFAVEFYRPAEPMS